MPTWCAAQFTLGAPALLHFPRQLLIEAFSLLLGVLQIGDQCLVVKALLQVAGDQSVDLPSHQQQGAREDQTEYAPTFLARVVAQQQHTPNGGNTQGKVKVRNADRLTA